MSKLWFLIGLLTFNASAQIWKNHHLVAGCRIYTSNGDMIKSFSGYMCIFLDDGTYISADDTGIRRISISSEKLWEIPGHYHHQINLSHDKSKILALASAIYSSPRLPPQKLRQDKLQIISLNGKIIHEKNFTDLLKNIFRRELRWDIRKVTIDSTELTKEYSHLNSFHEIPEVSKKVKKPVWMKPGNLLVNGLEQGFFVISPDLSEIIYDREFENSHQHRVHDVQVTKRGTLLYYNNFVRDKDEDRFMLNIFGGGKQIIPRYSGIFEVDGKTNISVRHFIANPPELFFAWKSGGIQELDDTTWLFNHVFNGVYIYSHKDKKILNHFITPNTDGFSNRPVQQVNLVDLSKFLSFWR